MEYSLFFGSWSGVPVVLITLVLGLMLFTISFVITSRIAKKFTPHIIMGITTGILMAIISMNSKICSIVLNEHSFPLVLSSLFFPTLALSTDVLNEFYGVKCAKALLHCFILTQLIMYVLMFWFVDIPSVSVENHNAFINTFSIASKGFIASVIAMYICNLADIYVFSYLRKLTKGKMLWSRVFGSTTLSLLLDIIIYTSILFVGTISSSEILQMMFISAMVRLAFSALEVPFLYLLKWLNKKRIFLIENDIIDA